MNYKKLIQDYEKHEKQNPFKFVYENVFDVLSESIVKMEISSGDVLREKSISERLGISRTPVRQALLLLKKNNLLRGYPIVDTWSSNYLLFKESPIPPMN